MALMRPGRLSAGAVRSSVRLGYPLRARSLYGVVTFFLFGFSARRYDYCLTKVLGDTYLMFN